LVSQNYVQTLGAEWALARPLLMALGTYAQHKVRAAQKSGAFPKRNQKSTILVCADQEFFQDGIPFVIGWFHNSE
jgi:hypothetical protein